MAVAKFVFITGSIRCTMRFLRNCRQFKTSTAKKSLPTVSDLRKEYSRIGLNEGDPITKSGPFGLFKAWIEDACAKDVIEPNAMCLSTCRDNKPSSRYVLLKGYDDKGFVWYTNYDSRKSGDINANPNAALTFWWGPLERSVRIEGVVEKVSAEESDAYFSSRPRGSQLGAWSSNQSSAIASREALDQQEQEVIARFKDVETIPRPPHWGGFRLIPSRIEFWKGRESRIHDRLVFERQQSSAEGTQQWDLRRLQP